MDAFLYNINIHLVPMVVVIVLYMSVTSHVHNFLGKRYFCSVLLCVGLGIISFVISWVPGSSTMGMLCVWLGAAASLLFLVLACYIWFVYVFCMVKQTEDLYLYNKELMAMAAPLILYMLLLLTTPLHDLLFDVNARGVYIRGTIAWLPYVIAAGYLLASSAIAWLAARRELLEDRRREYHNLMLFLVLPICGLIIQSFAYDYPATIPSAVLALVIIYFNMLKSYSAMDALTGLNNRRRFNRYLEARFANPLKDGWALVMLDLDGFKAINDRLGHTMGDEALVQMAHLLRASLRERRSFLARIGGDEFVILVGCKDEAELGTISDRLADNVHHFNQREDIPFMLHYSLGYTIYTPELSSAEQMLQIADERMYRDKEARRANRPPSVKGGEC